MKRQLLAAIGCSFAIAACSPEADLDQAREPFATNPAGESLPEEARAAPIATGGDYNLAGGWFDVPFKFDERYDRVEDKEDQVRQRQVFLEVVDANLSVEAIGDLLQEELERAGFVTDYIRPDDGVLRAKFSAEEFPAIFVLIRPDGVGPTLRAEGAIASVFITQVIPEA